MPVHVLGRVAESPENLRLPNGDELVRIDDPTSDRIAKGDPIFGWEGDPRYQLYVNHRRGRFELWRHEDDGVMRRSIVVAPHVPPIEMVAWLIQWLCEHDGRRGFDPVADVVAQVAADEKNRARAADEHAEEAADRLHFGLMKDIGHTEVGMSRRQFATPASPKEPTPPTVVASPNKETH